MVYTVGHPSGSIQEATTACDSVLVSVDNDAVTALVEENPFYRTATVPGGMYRGNDEDVQTFGVGATFVTSANVSDEAVYAVVSSVFENFEDFKGLHPAFANLKPEEMVSPVSRRRCIRARRSITRSRAGSSKPLRPMLRRGAAIRPPPQGVTL
jgi:TRAP transporter TAXI family solute receptor